MNIRTLFILLLAYSLFNSCDAQPQGRTISGTIYGFTNGTTKVFLYGYRGNESYKVDSSGVDKTGKFIFTHLKNIQPGLYSLKLMNYTADFVIGKNDMNIEISTSPNELEYQQLEIKNSMEHDAFMQLKTAYVYYNIYKDSIAEVMKQRETFDAAAKQLINYELNYNNTLKQIQSNFSKTYTAEMLVPLFLVSLKEENAAHNAEYPDDIAFNFHHYFDHVNFKDATMLNSPFYADKISIYNDEYLPEDFEAIKEAMDMLVSKAKNNLVIKEWTINYLLEDAERMGNHDLAAYIVQKHMSEGCESSLPANAAQMLLNIKNMKPGNTAPDLIMNDTKMKPVKLTDIKGKRAVLVFFWYSECEFCKEIVPDLIAYYDLYRNQGFEVYAISLDTKKENWISYTDRYKMQWINVSDLKGWESNAVNQYNVTSTPAFCLLDENFKIISRTDYIQNIDALLKEIFK